MSGPDGGGWGRGESLGWSVEGEGAAGRDVRLERKPLFASCEPGTSTWLVYFLLPVCKAQHLPPLSW